MHVADGILGVWQGGSGPHAIVLPGGPGASCNPGGLTDELGELSWVMWQQRGFAPTETRELGTIERLVGDAVAVLDHFEWDDALVVGHSFGGLLALHVAAAHPERVRGLLLISSLGGVGFGGWRELRQNLIEGLPTDSARRVAEIEERVRVGTASPEEFAERRRLLLPAYYGPGAPSKQPPNASDQAGFEAGFVSATDHYKARTIEHALPRLSMPALFIHGAYDPLPIEYAAATAERMPNAKLVAVPGCGHGPWHEKPGSVANAVKEWLRELENAPRSG